MFIACPKCETTFSLPDSLYKPGKKARCSQCGQVFPMPENAAEHAPDPMPAFGESAPAQHPPSSKRDFKIPILIAAIVILLLLLGYGCWLMFGPAPEDAAPQAQEQHSPQEGQPQTQPAQVDKAREALINGVALEEIRQFLVDNMVMGKILVIQGLATNTSQGNRDYISIEARILDGNNRVLAQSSQVCGVPLTLFQLQSLSEAELKESLDNRITILTNNTSVPPGGKVPFVVVFTRPPEGMRTFEVRVIDVRETPPQ